MFTINDATTDISGVDLARRVGSDVLIRGWFKWHDALPVSRWSALVDEVHKLGARFGGGITCSALFDGENGITQAALLDMATRGPDGQLVDAWGQPGLRHGSLSSPAYLDYLFQWCRQQIDAGADYLFMDEHTAVLQDNEGYDDHSLADFRQYLLSRCPSTAGWLPRDARWKDSLLIDLADPGLCPTGDMRSFDYRAYLRLHGWTVGPNRPQNPLAPLWGGFRAWRDDRAWRTLTTRIRDYASAHGRTVWISANGLAPYVDLQVRGLWETWRGTDLADSQLPVWRDFVRRGQKIAGKPVPVVLFHDWGFGNPPFPFLAVSPAQRSLWMRTRGAEMYAAGAFFAFPVLGPFGCDAAKDGTIATIATETRFYQSHRDLFLRGRYIGTEGITSDQPLLSLAAWEIPSPHSLALHVINRDAAADVPRTRRNLQLTVPLDRLPAKATAISPDWDGPVPVACTLQGNQLCVTLDRLDAHAVILLEYPGDVDVSRIHDPVRIWPVTTWARGSRNDFTVLPDGEIDNAEDLNGFVQGLLHTDLRNQPSFRVNAAAPGVLRVCIRSVAAAGAQLDYLIDGRPVTTTPMPDLDGKNDAAAQEYARVISLGIPAGLHRLTLDNRGPDWLAIQWLEFTGSFRPAPMPVAPRP